MFPVLVCKFQKICGKTGEGPKKFHKDEQKSWMICPTRKDCRSVGSFLPGEEKTQESLITAFQCLKGSYKEERGSFFTGANMEKTRSNGCTLYQRRFYIDIRNKLGKMRSITGISSPGTWWSPHCWKFSLCHWTGC